MSAWRVALSGGVCSGKSAVCRIFHEDYNVPIIDADRVAAKVLASATVERSMAEILGDGILQKEGRIDRVTLRKRLFSDITCRKKVEALLHPMIYAAMENCYKNIDALYCIFCIPLLLETERQGNYDRVVVVDTSPQLQMQRLTQRDQCSEEEAEAILHAQIDRRSRLQSATDIISNEEDVASLSVTVDRLHHMYSRLAEEHMKAL